LNPQIAVVFSTKADIIIAACALDSIDEPARWMVMIDLVGDPIERGFMRRFLKDALGYQVIATRITPND